MSAVLDKPPATLRWTTMGEIADVIGGGTPRTSESENFEGGDIPWITPADLSGYTSKFISGGARFITQRGLESSSARVLPAGTVLFTSRAPIGYVAIAANRIATNQGFKSFVLRPGVLPEYVYWWLRGAKRTAESLASGTTFLELSGANAKKLPIPMVDIDEQRRIVAEIEKQFSRLDEAVANLQRVKANIRRYAKAVLNAAADGTLWPLEADLISHEGLSASHWVRASLGDVATVLDPNPSHRMPAYVAQGIPLISSENFVGEEGIDFEKGKQVGAETLAKQRALFAIEAGDFVLSRIGTIGKTRLLPLGRDYCLSHALVVIKVRVPFVDKHWLRHAISSDRVLHQAHSGVQSVGVPDLGMGKMRAFDIRIPPLAEQHRIVAEVDRRLSIVREVEAEVDANLKRAQALRQAALTRAFDQ